MFPSTDAAIWALTCLSQGRDSAAHPDDLPDLTAIRRATIKAIEAEQRDRDRRARQKAKRARKAERKRQASGALSG